MDYSTRYGDPIARVLAAYMPGVGVPPALIGALETLIKTAQQNVQQVMRDEIAATVCEGLHPGREPKGLKCLRCYNAEHNFNEEIAIQAEMETKRSGIEPSED